MTKQLDYSLFIESLKPFKSIGLTAPDGADGDSVGTQCALKEFLDTYFKGEKTIRIINEDLCPQRYLLLEGTKSFELASEVLSDNSSTWPEVMLCVDGGWNRVGECVTKIWNNAKKTGQVDHHSSSASDCYDIRLFDPEAAATTEIVFYMLEHFNFAINQSIAQAIYTGLIFDTGLFKHSNTTAETMRIGASLLETGFNHTKTAEHVLMIRSQGALSMLRLLLSKLNFELSGRYVWSYISLEDAKSASANSEDREGMIDFLFLTRDCQIAVLLFEVAKGRWKVSFRARDYDVAKIAKSLDSNGGGHKKAAGCALLGTLSEALEKCHKAVRSTLEA